MAGFICDICGGQLKMLANKTCVCQGCGMEYDLEALRAMAGRQNPAPAATTAPASATDEISREALLVYLEDVRTLETLQIKDSEHLTALQERFDKQEKLLKDSEQSLSIWKESKKYLESKNETVSPPKKPKNLLIPPLLIIVGLMLAVPRTLFLSILKFVSGLRRFSDWLLFWAA